MRISDWSSDVCSSDLKANQRGTARRGRSDADAYGDYRDSVYRELQGLIEAPETPMLRPAQAVRTLILPYADRNRPDRLYMSRFVYSVLENTSWVVGGYRSEERSVGKACAGRLDLVGRRYIKKNKKNKY